MKPLFVFVLFFSPKDSEWKECPHYIYSNRECFFDANHTAIWVTYCLQLRSHNVTYFNEDDCFTVENIGELPIGVCDMMILCYDMNC